MNIVGVEETGTCVSLFLLNSPPSETDDDSLFSKEEIQEMEKQIWRLEHVKNSLVEIGVNQNSEPAIVNEKAAIISETKKIVAVINQNLFSVANNGPGLSRGSALGLIMVPQSVLRTRIVPFQSCDLDLVRVFIKHPSASPFSQFT